MPPIPNISLGPTRHQILICCIYRSQILPPVAVMLQIPNLHDDYPRLVLLGNFNAHLINLLNMSINALAAPFKDVLMDACKTGLMLQHFEKLTRSRGMDHHSFLDLLVTKDPPYRPLRKSMDYAGFLFSQIAQCRKLD